MEAQQPEPRSAAPAFVAKGAYICLRGIVVETYATPAEAAQRAAHLNARWGA